MSFAEGLASSLSGLPQALMYGQDKRRKDAKKKEIAGLSSADSPSDPEASIVRKKRTIFPSMGSIT